MKCRTCGYDEERQREMNSRNLHPTSSFMGGVIVEPDFIQREAKAFIRITNYFLNGSDGNDHRLLACPYCGTVKVEI